MSKVLSVVIPVFNNWTYTCYCLNCLKILSDDYEIIIVDNNSTDGTNTKINLFLSSMSNLKYIRNDKNLGFGAAVNCGFAVSSGEIVMFLNNDVKFLDKTQSWLDVFSKTVLDNNSNMLVGPTGGFVDSNFNFKYETSNPNDKINYMSAWCLAAKRSVWNMLTLDGQVGPFDSEHFFAYFEDTDLGFRCLQQNIGFFILSVPLIHIGKQTTKNMNIQQLYLQSKAAFAAKWRNKLVKHSRKN